MIEDSNYQKRSSFYVTVPPKDNQFKRNWRLWVQLALKPPCLRASLMCFILPQAFSLKAHISWRSLFTYNLVKVFKQLQICSPFIGGLFSGGNLCLHRAVDLPFHGNTISENKYPRTSDDSPPLVLFRLETTPFENRWEKDKHRYI